jgi:hypothetical protein
MGQEPDLYLVLGGEHIEQKGEREENWMGDLSVVPHLL